MLSPSEKPTDPLSLLLNNLVPQTDKVEKQIYWAADHYNLNQSSLYNSLSNEKKYETVLRLNQWSLELIYFIEKFGLNYGAKMIQLSETEQEKSLYSLFAGDEVRHRRMIEPYLLSGQPEDITIHPLLSSLSQCLKEGSKEAMTFTIQVILEGFGLMHYTHLKNSCLNEDLTQIFSSILQDEVNHHGMGVILTKKSKLNSTDKNQIVELTKLFINSLIHANWVEKSLDQSSGGMNKSDKSRLREEIQWEKSQSIKVNKLSELITKVGQKGILQKMEEQQVFSL